MRIKHLLACLALAASFAPAWAQAVEGAGADTVEHHYVLVPNGARIEVLVQGSGRPLVLLQNVHTGQEVYVMNTHNPADVRGKAKQWRDQAVRIEAALINQLRATHPDIPVLLTGDMNDWSNFFCPMTALAPVHSYSGGTHVLTPVDQCTPSQPSSQIDWVMGTPPLTKAGTNCCGLTRL